MDNSTKSEIAQLKAELRAIELGYVVSRPLKVVRYDLVVDVDGSLYRAQVKYAGQSSSSGSVVASLNYTDRSKKEVLYSVEEVDCFLVYLPALDKVLWFDSKDVVNHPKLTIRIDEKNKKSTSRWYEDYIW